MAANRGKPIWESLAGPALRTAAWAALGWAAVPAAVHAGTFADGAAPAGVETWIGLKRVGTARPDAEAAWSRTVGFIIRPADQPVVPAAVVPPPTDAAPPVVPVVTPAICRPEPPPAPVPVAAPPALPPAEHLDLQPLPEPEPERPIAIKPAAREPGGEEQVSRPPPEKKAVARAGSSSREKATAKRAPTRSRHDAEPGRAPIVVAPPAPAAVPAAPAAVAPARPAEPPEAVSNFYLSRIALVQLVSFFAALFIGPLVVVFGLFFLLRRYGARYGPLFRIETTTTHVGGAYVPAGPAPAAPPADFDPAALREPAVAAVEEESTAETFELGPTFEDERLQQEEAARQREQAMLQHVFEQNMQLRQEIGELQTA